MDGKPHLADSTKKDRPRIVGRRIWLVVNRVVLPLIAGALLLCCIRFGAVPSDSMTPTLGSGDRILINTIATKLGPVHRGDIVVIEDPGGWLPPGENPPPVDPFNGFIDWMTGTNSAHLLVKRVIGVGGDKISCCAVGGQLTVNGTPINEPYLLAKTSASSPAAPTPFTVTVPAGDLWVMGDNRANSADSLYHLKDPGHGFLSTKQVIGTVAAVVSPLSHLGFVDRSAQDTFFRVPDHPTTK